MARRRHDVNWQSRGCSQQSASQSRVSFSSPTHQPWQPYTACAYVMFFGRAVMRDMEAQPEPRITTRGRTAVVSAGVGASGAAAVLAFCDSGARTAALGGSSSALCVMCWLVVNTARPSSRDGRMERDVEELCPAVLTVFHESSYPTIASTVAAHPVVNQSRPVVGCRDTQLLARAGSSTSGRSTN